VDDLGPPVLIIVPGKRCPLSSVVVTAIPTDDWVNGDPYRCHACGALVTYRVRNDDYPGHARLHTHKVPRG
jgi:hypothetical protein